jgi:hypothetical protein
MNKGVVPTELDAENDNEIVNSNVSRKSNDDAIIALVISNVADNLGGIEFAHFDQSGKLLQGKNVEGFSSMELMSMADRENVPNDSAKESDCWAKSLRLSVGDCERGFDSAGCTVHGKT